MSGHAARMRFDILDRQLIMREPRPTPRCHASTLALLPGGRVAAAWFGGTKEGDDDVDIWGSTYDGKAWGDPRVLCGRPGIPHWNPVLFYDSGRGRLHLFYKEGKKIATWVTMETVSEDGGATWSQPRPLADGQQGGRGPVKNKPIVLSDGAWLAPASAEAGGWNAFVDRSEDHGQTWSKSGFVPVPRGEEPGAFRGEGVIQPTLWESAPGRVHMLLRSTEGWIYRSDSADAGRTWSAAYSTGLPNNNSGIDLVRMDGGRLVLLCNPVSGNWAARTPLVALYSTDGGAAWRHAMTLEDSPGEYSYPSVVSGGSDIYLTYSWNIQNIAFWHIGLVEEQDS